MRLVAAFALSLLLPGIQIAPPAPASGSKIWVGRYAEFETYIRTAAIERIANVGTGVTHPRHAFFAPGGLAGGVVLKNLPPRTTQGFFESYKSEIAAYELDKLLRLDMVPPTVEREVDGHPLSAQLWLDGVRTFGDVKNEAPPDGRAWLFQVNRQKLFDDLIANIDDNAGNLAIDAAWNLILVDHSRCFTKTTKLPFPLTQIDRAFYERVKALDASTLEPSLSPWLERGALEALLKRRDAIVRTIDGLVGERGDGAVLTPSSP
jgi:hypothetical protein